MRFSLFASFFMSLNPTLSIPLQTDYSPAADIFSSSEDYNLFDDTQFFEPDAQEDYSLQSPAGDLINIFTPSSFLTDDSGNGDGDIQLLLSSSQLDTSCPLGRRKRDLGVCKPTP